MQYAIYNSIINVFRNLFLISIFTLILAILAIIFVIISVFTVQHSKAFSIMGGVFGIILFILALFSVIYFMSSWTSLQNDLIQQSSSTFDENIGFWYTKSEGGSKISMGPGYGWYLMIISAIIAVIASIFAFLKPKNRTQNL